METRLQQLHNIDNLVILSTTFSIIHISQDTKHLWEKYDEILEKYRKNNG